MDETRKPFGGLVVRGGRYSLEQMVAFRSQQHNFARRFLFGASKAWFQDHLDEHELLPFVELVVALEQHRSGEGAAVVDTRASGGGRQGRESPHNWYVSTFQKTSRSQLCD